MPKRIRSNWVGWAFGILQNMKVNPQNPSSYLKYWQQTQCSFFFLNTYCTFVHMYLALVWLDAYKHNYIFICHFWPKTVCPCCSTYAVHQLWTLRIGPCHTTLLLIVVFLSQHILNTANAFAFFGQKCNEKWRCIYSYKHQATQEKYIIYLSKNITSCLFYPFLVTVQLMSWNDHKTRIHASSCYHLHNISYQQLSYPYAFLSFSLSYSGAELHT